MRPGVDCCWVPCTFSIIMRSNIAAQQAKDKLAWPVQSRNPNSTNDTYLLLFQQSHGGLQQHDCVHSASLDHWGIAFPAPQQLESVSPRKMSCSRQRRCHSCAEASTSSSESSPVPAGHRKDSDGLPQCRQTALLERVPRECEAPIWYQYLTPDLLDNNNESLTCDHRREVQGRPCWCERPLQGYKLWEVTTVCPQHLADM